MDRRVLIYFVVKLIGLTNNTGGNHCVHQAEKVLDTEVPETQKNLPPYIENISKEKEKDGFELKKRYYYLYRAGVGPFTPTPNIPSEELILEGHRRLGEVPRHPPPFCGPLLCQSSQWLFVRKDPNNFDEGRGWTW